jgi:hypothetical protein
LGDVQLTEILGSVMAEIYFAHIVKKRGANSSSLASLRLVQCINVVTIPAESGRILPTQLMVDVLMEAQHIVPSAYRDSQKECTNAMYLILISRFELFLGNTLRDVSDEAINSWVGEKNAEFTMDDWHSSCAKAVSDMTNLRHRSTIADIAPSLAAPTVHRGDKTKRRAQCPPFLNQLQSQKRAWTWDGSDRVDDLDNETRAKTSRSCGGSPNHNVTQGGYGTGGKEHSRVGQAASANKRTNSGKRRQHSRPRQRSSAQVLPHRQFSVLQQPHPHRITKQCGAYRGARPIPKWLFEKRRH